MWSDKDIQHIRRVIAKFILEHILNPIGCNCTSGESENSWGNIEHTSSNSSDPGCSIQDFIMSREHANLPDSDSVKRAKDLLETARSSLKPPRLSDCIWDEISDILRQVVTGDSDVRNLNIDFNDAILETNGDEGIARALLLNNETNKEKPVLDVGKNDFVHSKIQQEVEAAKGHTTCDIDSVIAFLDNLSIIRSSVEFVFKPSQMMNLKNSVHLSYRGKSCHHITNCCLATFGALNYSLYLLAPEIESEKLYHAS